MSLFSRLNPLSNNSFAHKITDRYQQAVGIPNLPVLHIRPFRDTPGIDAGTTLFRDLYRDPKHGTPPTYSFSLLYEERSVRVLMSSPEPERIRGHVSGTYPNSTVNDVDPADAFPTMHDGEYVAGIRFDLEEDCCFPLRHQGSKVDPLSGDPYTSLLPKVAATDGERVIVQLTFEPVGDSWFRRGKVGSTSDEVADAMQDGRLVGEINPHVVESKRDRHIATDIQNQRGRPAFHASLRVLAVGPTAEAAETRAQSIGEFFTTTFSHPGGQSLVPTPLTSSEAIQNAIEAISTRDLWLHGQQPGRARSWLTGTQSVLTDQELAVLVHIPTQNDVHAPDLDWNRMQSGPGAPADSTQHATETEEQDGAW
ncbi:hypothetical protein [Haladaptatus paucihalophilus]|uniref:DUF8128 domain-containing protein n=1 Tax=Haladaptatus paucihalophilus DX253 TaxID=797209 RepID=A0A1M7BY04_HALPU|nr:hypothetical protein [Haladaptatus paucihalophilus]SHL59817.1 hypothetical protein SAMN05444342_4211 [Haladaptatus paucihalophilus DX253]